jgi:hypothetical protein
MPVFGRSLRRQIRVLQEQLDISKRETRAARLDCGQERRDKAVFQRAAEHIGDDRVADAKRLFAAQLTIAARDNQLATWSSLAVGHAELLGRALRVRRAESNRLHAVIVRQAGELRDLKERLVAQEEELAKLQTANEAHYRDLAARPARARVQRGARLEMAS